MLRPCLFAPRTKFANCARTGPLSSIPIRTLVSIKSFISARLQQPVQTVVRIGERLWRREPELCLQRGKGDRRDQAHRLSQTDDKAFGPVAKVLVEVATLDECHPAVFFPDLFDLAPLHIEDRRVADESLHRSRRVDEHAGVGRGSKREPSAQLDSLQSFDDSSRIYRLNAQDEISPEQIEIAHVLRSGPLRATHVLLARPIPIPKRRVTQTTSASLSIGVQF